MTEIPRHLRKRADEARRAATNSSGKNPLVDRPADDLFGASGGRNDEQEDREAAIRNHADWSEHAERLDTLRDSVSEVLTSRSTEVVTAEAHDSHSAHYAKGEHRVIRADEFSINIGRVTTFGAELSGRQQVKSLGNGLMNALTDMSGGVREYAEEIDTASFDDAMGRIKARPEPRTTLFADVRDRAGLLVASFGVQTPIGPGSTEGGSTYSGSHAQVVHIGGDSEYHGHATTVFPEAYRPSTGMLGSVNVWNSSERLVTNEWAWPHRLGDRYDSYKMVNWQQYGTGYHPHRTSPERLKDVAVSGIELVTDFVTGDQPSLERANQQLVDTLSRL